jgi:prepilin-type processing-associated H-X9-DG protein
LGKPFNTYKKVTYAYYPWMIHNMLRPYAQNVQIFICPSATGPDALERYAKGWLCTWVYRVKDLGQNIGGVGGDLDRGLGGYKDDFDKNPHPMNIAQIDKPAEKIAFYCWAWGAGQTDRAKQYYVPHTNGSVYVYADGHAKYGVLGPWWYPLEYKPN